LLAKGKGLEWTSTIKSKREIIQMVQDTTQQKTESKMDMWYKTNA